MGQQYSVPQPGKSLRVIGAGLPRTGTASFARALEILLDGPVYHGGTQVTLGPESEIKTWIDVLSRFPPQDSATTHRNLKLIKSRIDGFVATADSPLCSLIPELMTLYPDAKVICTTRDVEKWETSMEKISGTATLWFLRAVLFLVPSMRYFVDYIDVLRVQWFRLYAETEPPTRKSYNKHIAWLREVVPKERLVFVDVKDGWVPLCQALELPVPHGVAFPRVNGSEAIDRLAKRQLLSGLKRWMVVFTFVGVGLLSVFLLSRSDAG